MERYTLWDPILGRACDVREGTDGFRENGYQIIRDWYDVEQSISNWISGEGFDSYASFIPLHNIQSQMSELLGIGISQIIGGNLSQVLHDAYTKRRNDGRYKSIFKSCLRNVSSFPADYLGGGLNEIMQNVMTEVFLFELKQFEKAFGEYLRETIVDHPDYAEKACQLFRKLVSVGLDEFEQPCNYLFNFNYTNPFSSLNPDELQGQCHIHGTVAENPEKTNLIFGVDGYGVGVRDKTYRFTKARRRADLLVGNNAAFDDSAFMDIYNNSIDSIKVYGHSLNVADYSYFHSWFDRTGLYDSSVKLYFIGTYEHEPDRDSVIALLEQYAATISNRSKGDNLLSRLIMENRLIFTCIED